MLASIILIGTILYFLYYHLVEKRRQYPPGPQPYPVVGNIFDLETKNQHHKFTEWSKKYGPVYTIWVGNDPNVVITDYQVIKEALVRQGDVFAGRPNNFLFEEFRDGKDYGVIINDGQIWKQQRRFALHVLRDFGIGRQLMEHKIMTEADKLANIIETASKNANGRAITIIPKLELAVANIISVLIMGHTFDGDKETKFRSIKTALDAFLSFASKPQFFLLSQYPWLRFIPLFGNFGWTESLETKKAFHDFLKGEIRDHKKDFDPNEEPSDYTAAFLKGIIPKLRQHLKHHQSKNNPKEMYTREKSGEDLEGFSETQLLAALFDMWIAGMETTLTTLSWALLYMIKQPDIQEQCFKEINTVMQARDDKVLKMSDKNDMPYVSATVAEIQRCGNLLPLNLQHKTMKDAVIAGYHIPSGTTVLPQISTVLSDAQIFPNPEKFDPERYLSEDGKKKLEMVIPFSVGKRACLGESLARMELFLLFGTLIQKFRFFTSKSDPEPTIEPREAFVHAPTPYKVSVELR